MGQTVVATLTADYGCHVHLENGRRGRLRLRSSREISGRQGLEKSRARHRTVEGGGRRCDRVSILIIGLCEFYTNREQNTHGILLQNISTGLGLFWDNFQKTILSETPISIVNSDFLNFFTLQSPLRETRGR